MQTLYGYTNQFLRVKSQLDELNLSDDTYRDTLKFYAEQIEESAEDLVKYQKELLILAEAQKAEATRLIESAKAKEAKAEAILKSIEEAMKAIDKKELDAGVYKLKFKKGSTITEVDDKLLPLKYWVTVPSSRKPMGKPELKKLVDAGTQIAGVKIVQNPDKLEVKM